MCPNCKKVNPIIKTIETLKGKRKYCRTVIGFKFWLCGFWVKPIYCNYQIN